MQNPRTLPPVTILGGDHPGGAYVLRIRVNQPLALRFGGFKRGKRISLPVGDYLYVGSAIASKGSMKLAARLLRHATRSGKKPPHPIRQELQTSFRLSGLASGDLVPPKEKKLHWHVDYLLDESTVQLVNALLLRVQYRLEGQLGRWLASQPETVVFEAGLGASDLAGNTHLLRVEAGDDWWLALPDQLTTLTTPGGQISTVN